MSVARNPDGDAPRWRRLTFEAKSRRQAQAGAAWDTGGPTPTSPYLVVPILGQSNAFGMGSRTRPRRPRIGRIHAVHQYAMSGPSKGTVILAEEPLMHEIPGYGVGFGMTFAKHLAEATGRHVLLIPGARGDTSFAPKNGYTWDPADTLDPGQPLPPTACARSTRCSDAIREAQSPRCCGTRAKVTCR